MGAEADLVLARMSALTATEALAIELFVDDSVADGNWQHVNEFFCWSLNATDQYTGFLAATAVPIGTVVDRGVEGLETSLTAHIDTAVPAESAFTPTNQGWAGCYATQMLYNGTTNMCMFGTDGGGSINLTWRGSVNLDWNAVFCTTGAQPRPTEQNLVPDNMVTMGYDGVNRNIYFGSVLETLTQIQDVAGIGKLFVGARNDGIGNPELQQNGQIWAIFFAANNALDPVSFRIAVHQLLFDLGTANVPDVSARSTGARVAYAPAFAPAGSAVYAVTSKQSYRGGGGAPSPPLSSNIVIDLDMFGVVAPAGTTWTAASLRNYFDEQGIVRSAAIDEWTTQHDPGTLEPLGPWAGSPRSNEIIESFDLTLAAWVKTGAVTAVLSTLSDGPDLTLDYSKLRGLSGANDTASLVLASATFTNDARIEPSFFIRRVSTSGELLIHQALNGPTFGNWSLNMSLLGAGWEWITRDHPAITISTEFVASMAGAGGVRFRENTGGPLDFDVAYVQQEEGTFSTSPMKTNGAAFDRLQTLFEGNSLVDLVNQTAGTLVIHGRATDADAIATFSDFSDGTTTDRIRTNSQSGALAFTSANSGGNDASASATGPADDTNFGIASTWEQNDAVTSVDGTSGTPDAVCDFPLGDVFTDLDIGIAVLGGTPFNGTFSRFTVADGAVTNAIRDFQSINSGRTPTRPLAPTGLVGVAFSDTQIDLTWNDNSDNETGFRLESSADGITGFTTVMTTAPNATGASDTGLAPGTTRFYRVIAESALGDSAASNIEQAATTGGESAEVAAVRAILLNLTATEDTAMEAFVDGSVADGDWNQIDEFIYFGLDSTTDDKKDWYGNAAADASLVGTMTKTAHDGYLKTSGIANYLETGFVPSTDLVRASASDLLIAVFFELTNSFTTNSPAPFGVVGTGSILDILRIELRGSPENLARVRAFTNIGVDSATDTYTSPFSTEWMGIIINGTADWIGGQAGAITEAGINMTLGAGILPNQSLPIGVAKDGSGTITAANWSPTITAIVVAKASTFNLNVFSNRFATFKAAVDGQP